MAHIEFVSAHPGVPRMLFGELQRAKDTPAKRMARTLIQKYAERVEDLIDTGKTVGEFDPDLDTASARLLFIGTIQGLVMQSLLAGDIGNMRDRAAGVFAIYHRAIENQL